MPGIYPPLFSGVIANGATQYVGVPITNAFMAGLQVSWPDATSNATLTFETTNLDATAAPVDSATGWNQVATITGPVGSAAGSSSTSLPVGARRGRMKAVAAANTTLEAYLAAAGVLGAGVATAIAAGATAAGNLTVQGQLLLANGTQALPAMAFASDPDTGVWRNAADSMRFNAGGGNLVTVSSAAGLTSIAALVASGRVQLPKRRETGNYTATIADCVIVMAGTDLTLTLPTTPSDGIVYFVRNQDATSLTVARNGQNINGAAANLTVLTGAAVVLGFQSGQGWFGIG